MTADNKYKLTGGTLVIIAMIVLIFGNAGTVSIKEKLDEVDEELFNIRLQLSGLKKEHAELKQLVINLTNGTSEKNTLPEVAGVEMEDTQEQVLEASLEPEIIQEASADYDNLVALAKKMNSTSSPLQSIDNKFIAEEVDASWAYDHENTIRTIMDSHVETDFILLNTTCKTTLCEVSMLADENNALAVGNKFAKLIAEHDWGGDSPVVMFNHEPKDGALVLYIGRDIDSFK